MDFTKLNNDQELDTYIAFFERHASLGSESPNNYLLVDVNIPSLNSANVTKLIMMKPFSAFTFSSLGYQISSVSICVEV